MNKIISVFSVFLLTFVLSGLFLHTSYAQQMQEQMGDEMHEMSEEVHEVKTFDLFWPVAAGKVPGDNLYFLKGLKEKLREIFIFNPYNKADYNIVLAEKRMAEAEKLLLENKDISHFEQSLQIAQSKREKAISLIKEVKGKGQDVSSLVNRLQSSIEKQTNLLKFWKTKGIDGAQSAIDKDLNNLQSDSSNLQS